MILKKLIELSLTIVNSNAITLLLLLDKNLENARIKWNLQ